MIPTLGGEQIIRHIVMWRIQAGQDKNQMEVLETLKQELENLRGQIEGVLAVEVGRVL